MEYLYYHLKIYLRMTKIKIIKIDPLSAALDSVGLSGGASKSALKYIKSLKKDAKPLIDKSLKQFPLKNRQLKGARGAPMSIKKDLLTVDKLQKVNQLNIQNPSVNINPTMMRNTRKVLNQMEKNIKKNYKKTDQGQKIKKEDSNFRKFLKEQKSKRTISTDFS